MTFVLPPARIFAGVITYADTGKPAANARLEIGASEEFPSTCISNMFGHTDATGHFHLNPHPGNFYFLTVYPPEGEPYLVYQKEIKLAEGEVPPKIEIALPRGVMVCGRDH